MGGDRDIRAEADPPTDRAGSRPRVLFVTGRLAEPSLRRVAREIASVHEIEPLIAVLPISVAALMTPRWIARHLEIPNGASQILLPGGCRGDLAPVEQAARDVPVERGPEDLRDLPGFFGLKGQPPPDLSRYDIEILAEINHAPALSRESLLVEAGRLAEQGADLIDLGSSPGQTWTTVGDSVKALRDGGLRVSIDSFDVTEISLAVKAGAELVLSVNSANRDAARDWGTTVVAVPDTPGSLQGLDETVEFLDRHGVAFCLDPILEPIGFGFAASLGRYLETRRRYPQAEMLMGVGNLTELTDVDSAGVNMLLAGFCQELAIRRVLTTSVINWARTSIRELDIARRLVHHAVTQRTLPKNLDPRLVMLRDTRVREHGASALAEIQNGIRDPNWRIFAEAGQIHAINNRLHLASDDPFVIFEQMGDLEPSHAFYLGYEMMKAKTALTLGKTYRQDQSLDWGYLTEAEISRHDRVRSRKQATRPATLEPPSELEP